MEEELWEEDFMERCFQEMLDEEEASEWFVPARDLPDARGQRADRPTVRQSDLSAGSEVLLTDLTTCQQFLQNQP